MLKQISDELLAGYKDVGYKPYTDQNSRGYRYYGIQTKCGLIHVSKNIYDRFTALFNQN